MKTAKLKGGIFAGGQGSRLAAARKPKPLVKIGGRPLIHHVLDGFAAAGVDSVTILINDSLGEVQRVVARGDWPFTIDWIVETTPSSMHSFLRVVETLSADGNEGPFLLSTVDALTDNDTAAEFFARARQRKAAITFAVNEQDDDDKPLRVACNDASRVGAIGEPARGSELATAGLYAVSAVILREAESARHDGLSALRHFLARLLERGYRIDALRIGNSIDVDRPTDIIAAENFLAATAT